MQETEGTTHTDETSLDNFIQTNLQRWQTELSELCAVQTVTAQSQFEPLLKSTRLVEIVEKALADRALETTKWETAATSQPVVFGKLAKQADAPTLLFYNHYDVQPVE